MNLPTVDEPNDVAIGQPLRRVDGPAKVTGRARYAAEHPTTGLLHGVVVCAPIALGRITRLDSGAARAVAGVVDVITHQNRPKMRSLPLMYKDLTSPKGSPFRPLHDDRIHSSGQPVALVVADSFEAARHAAALLDIDYETQPHASDLLGNLDTARKPSRLKAGYTPPPSPRGDVDGALAGAHAVVDAQYYAGAEFHNPMEMHASTVIVGPDGHLTIHDKNQGSQNCRWVVSRAFGLPKRRVTVHNAYVGGAFGSGLRPHYSLLMAVMAALHLQRSVRVVLTRQQMFTAWHRPGTWQRVRLAADADGRLLALAQQAIGETSRSEDHVEVVVNWASMLYRCDNVRLEHQVVPLDRFTPSDMRAPGAAHGLFATEVAMDELAAALDIDPLVLREANHTDVEPESGLPWSSKALRECFARGAERFGWAGRPTRPRARREGDEYIGWGMATGIWDALQMFARVHASFDIQGQLLVRCAASDIGTGTTTVMSQIAAAALGLRMADVTFQLGDSRHPVAAIQGGSSHVATVGSAVQGACRRLQGALLKLAASMPGSPFAQAGVDDVLFRDRAVCLRTDPLTRAPLVDLMRLAGRERLDATYLQLPDVLAQRKYARNTHSAVFCEVRVDDELGTVRVTRVVSAVAAGRIINPHTARSQIVGGVVWGISQALHEESQEDARLGRVMNHNFAEYHIAANADIPDIEVIFVDEQDTVVSPLGAKGVGEIGIVGVAAAVCNAIHHAVGRRVRSLPMTPDKVMAAD